MVADIRVETQRVMRSRSSSASLLRWTILLLSALDSILLATTMNTGAPYRVSRSIRLPQAITSSMTFPCREPQSRSYNLKDLVHDLLPGLSANQPVYIVLKRCDSHSGCCSAADRSCSPVQSEIYYEEIQIEMWSIKVHQRSLHWIRVEQHGKCQCNSTNINDRYETESQLPKIVFV